MITMLVHRPVDPAQLQQAAPDLLAVCRESVRHCWHANDCDLHHFDGQCDCYLSRLKAAIAKAEGSKL